jgi:hypothetical protein
LAMQVRRQGQVGCAAGLPHRPADRILDFLRNEVGRVIFCPPENLWVM